MTAHLTFSRRTIASGIPIHGPIISITRVRHAQAAQAATNASISGGTLLVADGGADVALIELSSEPLAAVGCRICRMGRFRRYPAKCNRNPSSIG